MSSPNGSAFSPTLCRPGSRESIDDKGLLPHITNSFKNSHDVKYSVAHQILFSDFSPPPNYEKSRMRIKKPASKNLVRYNRLKKDFLKHLQLQGNSASKVGSTEDSGSDQYSVYSLRGPLSSLLIQKTQSQSWRPAASFSERLRDPAIKKELSIDLLPHKEEVLVDNLRPF